MTHLFNFSVFLQDLIVDNLQKNDMPRITMISKNISADFFLQRHRRIEEAALACSQDTLVSSPIFFNCPEGPGADVGQPSELPTLYSSEP